MKRSAWLRIIAVILIISMVAAPVSAAGAKGSTGTRNHLIGNIADMIRDLFRDRFGGSFGQPGEEPTTPSNPVDPTTPTEPDETEPEESEPEISLELIEDYSTAENGHLLRGASYSLTELLAEQSNPPFSLRNNGFGATSLGGNTAGSLSLGRTPLNAMAESDTTAVSAKIEGITGTGSSVDTSEPAFDKSVANAFDGDVNTFWATVQSGTLEEDYLIADLHGEYTIDKVVYTKRVHNGSYNCTGNLKDYIIEVSTDGETWTQVATGNTNTTGGTTEITFNAVPATHVRLRATSSYHHQSANVNKVMTCAEFEVYGYTESTEEPDTIDPTDDSRDIPTSVLTATSNNYQSGDDPDHVLDGNNSTIWHTVHQDSERDTHWIQFTLSESYTVDGLRYLPRQTGNNGTITEYQVLVSNDGETWTEVATGTWAGDSNWKIAQFEGKDVKYVRLKAVNAMSGDNRKFASAAEIRLTGEKNTEPEQPVAPEEPEQPAIGSELVYFPVTMFNYNEGNDDTILYNLTHKAEIEAGFAEKELWEGLYFSGGTPYPSSYSYSTTATAYADLTWQQVKDGTYYADEACTEQVAVEAVTEGGAEWNPVTLTATDDTYIQYAQYSDGNYYYKNGDNYEVIADLASGWGGWYIYYGEGGWDYANVSGYELTIYTRGGEPVDYKLVAGGETLKNLGGTDLSAKVNVTLYTPAGTKEITKNFAAWNFWSYKPDNNNSDNAQNKFYAGLVQDELVNGEIKFNVVEPGIFTFDPDHPEITKDEVKDIYQNVGLPFVKNEKGYYTFDSDAHGTYFSDTTGDGKSDPGYGASDNYFDMYFDYQNTQGWADKSDPDSDLGYGDKSKNLWAPYNTNANDTGEGAIDYHFGMRADIPFSMTSNGCIKSTDDNSEHITFTFQGDDDVWIFIDGHLVIDLGGIHNRLGATIDFADNTITYFLPESNGKTLPIGSFNDSDNYPLNADGTITVKLYNDTDGEGALGQTRTDFASDEEHEMSIFYLERGKGTSNCKIEFNLPMRDTVLITKDASKSWSEAKDNEDGEGGDGTDDLTAKEQAAVDKLNFGFTLYKKTADETVFTAVTNTNFFVQDKTGKVIATSSTDGNGKFYLKNGQTAKFMTDIPKEGITYYVVEDAVPAGFLTPDYKYAGAATWGYDYIGEAILKDENGDYILDAEGNLTSGIVSGTVTNAADMGEHELPMDATENKSYEVTVKGSVESIDSIEFICTNYLDAELPNPSALANEDIIVIDYGLPVQIDPLANDLFRGDNIEIVAWGDESLTLNEVKDESGNNIPHDTVGGTNWSGNKVLAAAKVAANNNSYNNALIDLADCLYTFKAVGDGCYEVSATTADGTKVYLNHYTSDTNEIPHDSIPGRIKIGNGANQNMFKLIAQVMEGGTGNARTLHFHTEQTVPYWNRCGNDTSFKCQEYLYRPAGKDDVSSTEIPGYVMVTSLDQIVDGGQYLIVHDKDYNSTDDDLFVLHPSTSGDKYDHVAKLETTDVPAIGTSFSFDSGNVTFKDETYAEHAHEITNDDGTTTTTYTYTRDSFEYELTEQLTEVEEIRYIIKVTSSEVQDGTQITNTACRYALGKIYIVPATIMYYEENFDGLVEFAFGNGETAPTVMKEDAYVSPYQEPGVVGTVGDSTYGSDEAYLEDSHDSNGTSYFFDTTNGYVRFKYTFTGTGTTFFARTSANTGYMQVLLFEGDLSFEQAIANAQNGLQKDTWYRDTYYNDTNGYAQDADGTLYNIPVYTNDNQPYGTYTVLVTVAKAGAPTAGPYETGSMHEFYLDGIRVMQPLNESAEDKTLTKKALDAYATDGEANLDVVTLREKLLEEWPVDDESEETPWDFVVLTDTVGNIVKASEYESIGPKEEVYLAASYAPAEGEDDAGISAQKVSFSLMYWQPEGLKLYMGMKAPFGHAHVNVGNQPFELLNATDCYYDVTNYYESLIEEEVQLTTKEGWYVYTDQDGNTVYEQYDDKAETITFFDENRQMIEIDDLEAYYEQLTEVMTTCYIVTYSFEAAEVNNINSVVSLTNIKVVGSHEFTIIRDTDIIVP